MQRIENRMDTVAGAIALFIGLAIVWQAATHLRLGTFRAPGPGLFPFLIGCVVVLLAICLLIFHAGGGDSRGFAWARLRRVLPVYLSLIAYFVILEWVGFLVTSFGLLLYLSIAIGKQRTVGALVRAVIMAGLSYILFELVLNTPLPKGFLGGM
jgi:putative tricarboxylic transport membrane protein